MPSQKSWAKKNCIAFNFAHSFSLMCGYTRPWKDFIPTAIVWKQEEDVHLAFYRLDLSHFFLLSCLFSCFSSTLLRSLFLCCHCTCLASYIFESNVLQVCQTVAVIILHFIFHLNHDILVWVITVIFWCSINICILSKRASHHFQGKTFLHRKLYVRCILPLVLNISKLTFQTF